MIDTSNYKENLLLFQFYPIGTLLRDDLVRLLKMEGEPLTDEEAEELLLTLPLQEGEAISLNTYVSQLVTASIMN